MALPDPVPAHLVGRGLAATEGAGAADCSEDGGSGAGRAVMIAQTPTLPAPAIRCLRQRTPCCWDGRTDEYFNHPYLLCFSIPSPGSRGTFLAGTICLQVTAAPA